MKASLDWPAQIAPLTSLRFLAAMLVVLLHFSPRAGWDGGALFGRGYLAVDFFFILSGFVLAHVYMGQVRAGRFSWAAFIEKRLARLWPLHLATLAGVIGLYGLMLLAGLEPNNPARYDFSLLPANLFMLHAWGFNHEQSFNYPSWSVSAEWFAYLWFGLFAAGLLRLWRRPVLFAGLAALFFAAMNMAAPALFGAALMHLSDGQGIWRIVPEFLIGMGIWRLGLSVSLPARQVAWHVHGALALIIGLAAAGGPDILFAPLFAWLIFSAAEVARHDVRAARWLSARPLVYLGDVSFGIYMVHALVYTVWFNGLDVLLGKDFSAAWRVAIWAAALPVVILTAMAAHHLVELPGKRLILKLAPLRHLAALVHPLREGRPT